MRDLTLDLDPALGRRAGLEYALRKAIRSGQLTEGTLLPSTRSLSSDLGLARATVVAAYEQLAIEGYVVSRQGFGTTVSKGRHARSPTEAGPKTQPDFEFDFRPGEPDTSAFPCAAWLRSVRRVVSTAADDVFGYGDPAGRPELRVALADYLSRTRAVSADAAGISVFGGVTSAVGFVGEVLARRGIDQIAVEDPALWLLRDVFGFVGVTPVPIPVDHAGLCVEHLQTMDVRAVLVTPGHQYPMGVTMSATRRSQLVDWARTRSGWIVEDDYDGEFRYDRARIGALQGLDPDRVIYVGTTSKSLAPSLRLGWLVIPAELRSDFGRVKSVRAGVSAIDQVALADFIDRGEFDRHVRHARGRYQQRHDDLCAGLDEVGWLHVPRHPAGLHVTATYERDLDEADIEALAATEGIGLMGLERHWLGEPRLRGLVFGYSRPAQHQFTEALDRLLTLLHGI